MIIEFLGSNNIEKNFHLKFLIVFEEVVKIPISSPINVDILPLWVDGHTKDTHLVPR